MRRAKYPEGASIMLRALGALRGELISFNEFERRTRADWTRIAKALHAKWPLPPSVSIEDVRQELLLAIVIRKESSRMRNLLEKWNPQSRSKTPLDQYVVWNARVQAARWIHSQRGAKRNRTEGDVAGKISSKFFRVLSSVERVSDRSDTLRIEVPIAAMQEQLLILDEGLQAARKSTLKRTRDIAEALLRGKAEIATRAEARGKLRPKSSAAGMVSRSRNSEQAQTN